MDEGAGDHDWVVAKLRFNTDVKFDSLQPVDGKITGAGKCRGYDVIVKHCIKLMILSSCKVRDGQVEAAQRSAGQSVEVGRR